MILQRFSSPELAAQKLAEQVAVALRSGIVLRGAASIVVPGGRTPVPFFHALREMSLDWSRVAVTLTDERWVSEDHVASNAAMVRRELLIGAASAARFYSLYDGSDIVGGATAAVWASLVPVPRPFDAVVLGMGDDGHFASLFPQSPGLSAALDPGSQPGCVEMRAPSDPGSRISLNLAALLQTQRLFLLLTGVTKRDLVLEAARQSAAAKLPVAALLSQRFPMAEVYWAP